MRVDVGAVGAVDGMGVVGVVAGMEVELDVEVDSTAPGRTAAHDGQNQIH